MRKNQDLFGKGLNSLPSFKDHKQRKLFESKVGKGENAVKQRFTAFLQCFLSYQRKSRRFT